MPPELYDFIIIGGGPTGSTAAICLSRKKYKVLVLEREYFPRQHVGESLLPFCYPLFKELGVLETMKKRFVRKPGARFTNHDGTKSSTWCFRNVIHDESYLSFHVVRADFDKMLLDKAKEEGAIVSEGTKVESVDLDRSDDIVEVKAMINDDQKIFHCRFLIDASGQDTFLARRLGDKKAYKELDRIAFLTHWKGAKYVQGIDVGLLQICYLPPHKGGWFGIQPVGKDRISVGLIIDRKYLKEQKAKFKAMGHENDWQMQFYLQECRETPLTKNILENASIAQPLIAVSDFSYFAEKTFGHNFVMLGDAGKFLDPIFASGVYLGMNSSKLFAEALDVLMKEGREKGMQVMTEKKKHIDGAYDLIEKFVGIYYDPESFNLAEISSTSDSNYKGYETAFSLLHYLLAGDFFNKYETYIGFLDMLRNPKQFARWKNLVVHKPNVNEETCATDWNTVFGEIDDELLRTTSINKEQA
ncbi:MAG TPA: tryptophan 7-halogenase [Bacteroidia bacterium]|jgi:flavin-dependent dehydrogenase|nr:tryptophan 7-halogenase [Bacteroidia bacterium]